VDPVKTGYFWKFDVELVALFGEKRPKMEYGCLQVTILRHILMNVAKYFVELNARAILSER
jgi:hypothetical protein